MLFIQQFQLRFINSILYVPSMRLIKYQDFILAGINVTYMYISYNFHYNLLQSLMEHAFIIRTDCLMNISVDSPNVSLNFRNSLATRTSLRRCYIRNEIPFSSLHTQNDWRVKTNDICANNGHKCFPFPSSSLVNNEINVVNRLQCVKFSIT